MSADAHGKPGILLPVDVEGDPADAGDAWRRALKELLGDKGRFDSWREKLPTRGKLVPPARHPG